MAHKRPAWRRWCPAPRFSRPPLSSEFGTPKPVTARLWPSLEPFSVRTSVKPSCSLRARQRLVDKFDAFVRSQDGNLRQVGLCSFFNAKRSSAVERARHTQDSHGQILALAFRRESLIFFEHFPLRPERQRRLLHHRTILAILEHLGSDFRCHGAYIVHTSFSYSRRKDLCITT
jgi:hypothetical protein